MDKCYIISYELGSNALVPDLHAAIQSYRGWAKITNSTWAVVTQDSATHIRDKLKSLVGIGGRIVVIKSGIEGAWGNVICRNEWLKNNL